jgi:hypothetical protein
MSEALAPAVAVELVIAHRTWLKRTDFLDAFTYTDFDTEQTLTGTEWDQAVAALDDGHLACSPGEAQILQIAASLARRIPVDLGDAATGLDRSNTQLVVNVISHATGHTGLA